MHHQGTGERHLGGLQGELAGESGQLYSIPQIIKDKHLDYEADEIGFVFPDYAATAPLMVREFVSKAHFKAQYIFSVITFGNFAANVADWWNDFCKEKGLQNHYINTLLMVDNYLPVFDMNEQVKIDKKIPENLAAIVGDIHEHKQFIAHFEQMDERMQDFLKRLQDSDGIASWRTMQSRLESLSALGIPTEFHSYNGLPHGFGLGTGTVAEGWLIDAVRFWQQQSGANDIRSAKANTRQQNSIYSLNGTRRNAIQKGINIVDGKKVAF